MAQPFVPGQPIDGPGFSMSVTGTPAAGDRFSVAATHYQRLDEIVGYLTLALTSGEGDLADVVETTLAAIDATEVRVLETRSTVGGRLNLVDNARDLNAPMEIASRSLLSNIEDVDFTAAVSRLSLETFVLEATQQSFVRVASLNLFNLL